MPGGTQRRVREPLTSGITWEMWSKLTPEEQEAVAAVNPVVKDASRPLAYDADTGGYRPAKEGEEVVADEGKYIYLSTEPGKSLPRVTLTALGKLYGNDRWDSEGHHLYPKDGSGYAYGHRNNPNPFQAPTPPPEYRTMRLYQRLTEGPLPPQVAQIYGKEVGPVIDLEGPYEDILIPQIEGDPWASSDAYFKEHPELSGFFLYDWEDRGLGKENEAQLLQGLTEGWKGKDMGGGRVSQGFTVPFMAMNIPTPSGGDWEKSVGGFNWVPGNWQKGSLVSPELTLKGNPDANVIGSYSFKATGGTLGRSYGEGGMRVMKRNGGRYVKMS